MIPPIVIGLNFKLIYDQFGPLNSLTQALGFGQVGWLSSPLMARISIILADVWQWTPFMFIIILAGLQAVNPEYERARVGRPPEASAKRVKAGRARSEKKTKRKAKRPQASE